MGKKYYRINQFIKAPKLRVIGADGKQIGILEFGEALKKATELEIDLVEIAPNANPPVAKLIDFKKFLYLEGKRERKIGKAKGGEVKEIRFTPFIAKADFEFRIKRAKEFLGESNKVKIVVRFMGRQLTKKEFGYEILKKVVAALSFCSIPEGEPKWMGRDLTLTLTPIKKGDHGQKQTENQQINIQTV